MVGALNRRFVVSVKDDIALKRFGHEFEEGIQSLDMYPHVVPLLA